MANASGFPTSRYIHLNVGGVLYMTSQETLTRYPDSMLGFMFTQDKIPLARDEQGRFLIDRDGILFRHILNFLRDGRLGLPEDFNEHTQLLAEASFYQLEDLVRKVGVRLNVGGVHYITTKAALTKHNGSRLKEMFAEEPILLDKDGEGRYIIKDGDGDLFQYILHYLEDGDLCLPEKFRRFEELEIQAKRFKLEAIPIALKVCLNVGGLEYNTTRATLIKVKGSLLEEIFTRSPIPLERDELGRFVINRNGIIFQYILNYLSTMNLNLPENTVLFRSIIAEVTYYKLGNIIPQVRVSLNTLVGRSFPCKFQTSWKNLTKYKGSLLEEMFVNANVKRSITMFPGDGQQFNHIINFLETGNIAGVPRESYPKLLQEARRYRLPDLERLLTND